MFLKWGSQIEHDLQLSVVHDPDLDRENLKNPRQFCAVSPKERAIRCSQFLEFLPAEARLAVLLHEIAHHEAEAFGNDACEVDADLWILEHVPEAEYCYAAEVPYIRQGQPVVANNLQTVSRRFSRMVRGR